MPEGVRERWLAAPLVAGRRYLARASELAENLDTTLEVQAPSGRKLGENDDSGGSFASCVACTATEPGSHVFLVRDIGRGMGPRRFAFRVVEERSAGC